jgi:hypothetical protein
MSTAEPRVERETMDALVGRRVFHEMWDRKLTQTAFAREIGIDQSGLAKKLRGQRGWSLDEVQRVARALSVSVSYLFGETEDPRPHGGGNGGLASRPGESNPRPIHYE